jgi:hypothetical protein
MSIPKERLSLLSDPAIYAEAGIERKWRVLRVFGNQCEVVAYQDARDVQKVLDYVCGPENWANEAINLNGKLYMSVSINVTDEGWISKSDVGTESNVEKVKGEASDALKRAAVMWGVFRNLYDLETVILPAKGKTPVTAGGKELKTPAQLSAYCNGMNTGIGLLMRLYMSFEAEFKASKDAMSAMSTIKNFLNGIRE